MRYKRIFVYLLGMLYFLVADTQSYAISQLGNLYLNWNCTLQTNQFGSFYGLDVLLTGIFDANDWNSVDSFGFQIRDGRGVIIASTGTSAPTGSTQYQQSFSVPAVQLGIDINSIRNPLTIEIYEDTGVPSSPYESLLTSVIENSPCFSSVSQTASPEESTVIPVNPVVAAEQERGIVRVFDDGIVITYQPDGDYQYYTPDGCLIGYTPNEMVTSVSVYTRRIIQPIDGCNGYRIDLWSLGYPACQLQLNAYLPNGQEKIYEFESFAKTVRCQREFSYEVCPDTSVHIGLLLESDVPDGCITGASPDIAEVVYINGRGTNLTNHIHNRHLVQELGLGNVMGIFNGGISDNLFTTRYLSQTTNTLITYLSNTTHPITIIGHSQGGAIISDALKALEGTGRLDNITIYTFGSAGIFYSDEVQTIRHCVFLGDPVISDIPRALLGDANTRVIEITGINHNFSLYIEYFDECIE